MQVHISDTQWEGVLAFQRSAFARAAPRHVFAPLQLRHVTRGLRLIFFLIWLVDVTRGLRCRAWLLRESREGRVTGDELQQRQQQQQADDVKEGDGAASATPKSLVASKSKYSADEVM